jgi:hypothetical protein
MMGYGIMPAAALLGCVCLIAANKPLRLIGGRFLARTKAVDILAA